MLQNDWLTHLTLAISISVQKAQVVYEMTMFSHFPKEFKELSETN